VATGVIQSKVTAVKKRADFQAFMDPESVSKYHKNTNFPIEINHLACM
jgi:hypothetical protein